MIIENVHAREILDSRGNPTVEVEVLLKSGVLAVHQFRQVLQLVRMRHWSFVMATRAVIVAREY